MKNLAHLNFSKYDIDESGNIYSHFTKKMLKHYKSVDKAGGYYVVSLVNDDGKIKVQLDFMKLPKEVIPDLERLLSVDYFKNHRLLKYVKNGQARTGLEIEVSPKDLPGTAYDYAF